jgi:hypothetical protein
MRPSQTPASIGRIDSAITIFGTDKRTVTRQAVSAGGCNPYEDMRRRNGDLLHASQSRLEFSRRCVTDENSLEACPPSLGFSFRFWRTAIPRFGIGKAASVIRRLDSERQG